MPDYQEMYKILFNAIIDCINTLQNAQIKTEELYISSEPAIKMISSNQNDEEK